MDVCTFVDCLAVATKVQFIMDDLLWILTDSQMKAAVIFARHIKQKIDEASEQSKAESVQALQVHASHLLTSPSTSSLTLPSFHPAHIVVSVEFEFVITYRNSRNQQPPPTIITRHITHLHQPSLISLTLLRHHTTSSQVALIYTSAMTLTVGYTVLLYICAYKSTCCT